MGLFLCSSTNEEESEGDMADQGVRLAQEINTFINEWCAGSALGRLSFVCFSQGGLTVRAALPFLEKYKEHM